MLSHFGIIVWRWRLEICCSSNIWIRIRRGNPLNECGWNGKFTLSIGRNWISLKVLFYQCSFLMNLFLDDSARFYRGSVLKASFKQWRLNTWLVRKRVALENSSIYFDSLSTKNRAFKTWRQGFINLIDLFIC